MLHMVEIHHGPETCSMGHPELQGKVQTLRTNMDKVLSAHGAKMQGGWTDMPNHTVYMLVDADSGHVVNDVLRELELMTWNTCTVHPVVTLQESMAIATGQ